MIMVETNRDFLGTGWSFPPTFANQGEQLEMVSGGNPVEIKLQRIQETVWGSQLWQITLTLRAR